MKIRNQSEGLDYLRSLSLDAPGKTSACLVLDKSLNLIDTIFYAPSAGVRSLSSQLIRRWGRSQEEVGVLLVDFCTPFERSGLSSDCTTALEQFLHETRIHILKPLS